ncbi:glutathione S-transferase family protein [Marinobacter sp.]|uniref:glutathione S-transferase family protein n=1 Tax=Marinobacter sp. TaxID=50741 RepID=UPI0039A7349A
MQTEVNALWQVLDDRLVRQPFLAGNQYGVADILLAVYARWGDELGLDIQLGPRVVRLVERVTALPSFQQALQAEARFRTPDAR